MKMYVIVEMAFEYNDEYYYWNDSYAKPSVLCRTREEAEQKRYDVCLKMAWSFGSDIVDLVVERITSTGGIDDDSRKRFSAMCAALGISEDSSARDIKNTIRDLCANDDMTPEKGARVIDWLELIEVHEMEVVK